MGKEKVSTPAGKQIQSVANTVPVQLKISIASLRTLKRVFAQACKGI